MTVGIYILSGINPNSQKFTPSAGALAGAVLYCTAPVELIGVKSRRLIPSQNMEVKKMAVYFMGFSSGTSKKSNEPFYCVTLLRQRFGRFVTVPSYYASEQSWNAAIESAKQQGIKDGSAVSLTVDIDGHPTGITLDKSVPRLDLRA